ncbi:linear amide C-N hydrolase [Romboutsia weinsteinii]|uniref:choloylglycine hydrolase n=1 Tax=Romboutsia weinsteinii TaxID=2020949 RepID=A0A371J236_9FIRM|nr:choloylglycine hydrolase [Romboutsia weinsteinii]RDY26840.1 linear amide C-N hydrolase [Romboutsia weinsteinii]
MCTALTLTTKDGYHLFGRNMDLEYSFNQSIDLVPRNFSYINKITNETEKTKYAMIGMGIIMDNHPLFAEAMNEKGLACAGLNFPGYAHWEETSIEGKTNIAPYDVILWILANFETIEQLKPELEKLNIVGKPFAKSTPLPTLHWIVTDKKGDCIVIEKTKDKLTVFDNKVGVLTNSPTFDWHITNLNNYMGITPYQPSDMTWSDQQLKPLGQGAGGFGLPGDFSSTSRFVKVAFLRSNVAFSEAENSGIIEFFHILNGVAFVRGSVETPEQKNDITQYTSCMCQEKGIYYYNTYNNNQIRVIDMNKENLDDDKIKIFEYKDKLNMEYEN